MARIITLAAAVLFALTAAAGAGNVDWSEYVDHNAKPSAPVAQAGSPTEDAPAAEAHPRVAAASKPAKKASKTKAKAKSKTKARSTKKRRH